MARQRGGSRRAPRVDDPGSHTVHDGSRDGAGTTRRTTTGRPLTRFRTATPPHGSPATTRAAGTARQPARARTTGPAGTTARRDRPRHLPTVPAIPAVP